jgi:hypothetical protein
MPYCRPEIDCTVDEDGDGLGVCDDCDDTDPNNYPGNEERCDGFDNDCDERLDESFPLGEACQIGEGICRSGGTTICAANEMEVTCDGAPGEPADEICDGLDNDCDGVTDEGFNLMAMCTVGVGACARPGVISCNAEGGAACEGQPGMPGIETCNEIDDDCDTVVDEELGLLDACTVGRGICAREGQNRCNPNDDGSIVCSVEAGDPAEAESCNPWTMIAMASSTRGIQMAAQNANPGGRVGVDPVLSRVSRVVSSVSLRQPVSMKSAMDSMMTATSISMKYRVSVSAAQQA